MKTLTLVEMTSLNGGVNWKEFAQGFCDGLGVTLMFGVGGAVKALAFAGASLEVGCNVKTFMDY